MRATYLLFLLFSTTIWAQEDREIRAVLSDQVDCWNAGDLECFMEGYWKSDKLVFVRPEGLRYGWEANLEAYKKNYSTPELMGILSFDLKIVEPLSDEFWFVSGKWILERKDDNPNGHFTLILRKIDDQWFIVSDHTS